MGAGLTRWQVRALVDEGRLVPIRHGVYATTETVATAKRHPELWHAVRALATMMATSSRPVVASHETAAQLYGFDLLNDPPEELVTLTRPSGGARGHSRGTRLVSARLYRGHVTKRHGVPVTTPARTVIDLARTLPFMDGVVVADSALHASKVTKAELAAILECCGKWPGGDRARRVVKSSDQRAESVLESCARVVFERNGLEPPELQTYIRTAEADYRVDFYWPKYRTIAEADGLKKYENKNKAIEQLERDELLRGTGRHVLHFTWRDVFYREHGLIWRLTETFASQPPTPAGRLQPGG
jgi:very-short-patch-repair endonuclease